MCTRLYEPMVHVYHIKSQYYKLKKTVLTLFMNSSSYTKSVPSLQDPNRFYDNIDCDMAQGSYSRLTN